MVQAMILSMQWMFMVCRHPLSNLLNEQCRFSDAILLCANELVQVCLCRSRTVTGLLMYLCPGGFIESGFQREQAQGFNYRSSSWYDHVAFLVPAWFGRLSYTYWEILFGWGTLGHVLCTLSLERPWFLLRMTKKWSVVRSREILDRRGIKRIIARG